MPLREFVCPAEGSYQEIYHGSVDPAQVPAPTCKRCGEKMEMIWSVPQVDTADTFKPFNYRGPDGIRHEITNLHKLRAVEHSYLQTGHNVRFDAYSSDPNNPDTVDGMGMPYNPRDASAPIQPAKTEYGFMKG